MAVIRADGTVSRTPDAWAFPAAAAAPAITAAFAELRGLPGPPPCRIRRSLRNSG
jgi:hypothetical protein